jgi:hypothetical protein
MNRLSSRDLLLVATLLCAPTVLACLGSADEMSGQLDPADSADGGEEESTDAIERLDQAQVQRQVVGLPGDVKRGLRWCGAYEWVTGISVAHAKDGAGKVYGIQQLTMNCAWNNGPTGTKVYDTGQPTSTVNYRSTAKPNYRLVGFGVVAGHWIDGLVPIYESFNEEQFQTGTFTGNTAGGTYRTIKCPKGWTVRGIVWTHDTRVKNVIKSMQLDCSP